MKTIALGYHDIVEEEDLPQWDLPIWNRTRPGRARYALDRGQLHEHLAKIYESGGRTRITVIGSTKTRNGEIPVFLTFDDGGIGSYTCAAAELEACNWRGYFLVTTDWIGQQGFMSPAQIRELHNRGHVIGTHTCSHPARMPSLTWAQLRREWSTSRAILSDIVGSEVSVASIPNGYYSRMVAQAAAASGIKLLFTSEPTCLTRDISGCLVVGRYSVLGCSPSGLSAQLALGSRTARWRQAVAWQIKKGLKAVGGSYYASLRIALLSRGAKVGSGARSGSR